MFGRQVTAGPKPRIERLQVSFSARDHDHERRQVFVHAPQSVTQPRAHRSLTRLLPSGIEERNRWIVIDRFGVHRFDDRDIVNNRLRMRKQLAHPGLSFAVLFEFEHRRDAGKRRLF